MFTDPDVDVIYITTPHNTHLPFMEKALRGGKHVLAEKSITLNSAELERVRALAKEKKLIFVDCYTSWCGPCKMEMPDFNEKYLEIGEEVQFLIINMTDGSRETIETASAFIAEQGYSFPVFYDTDQDASAIYGVYSLPTTYFIDAEGNAIAQATGAIDEGTLQRGIDMIISDR